MEGAGQAPCKGVGQTADVDFRVLGSVGIVDGTALLPLGGGMPRRLLAVLLAYRNSVVSTDRLCEVLWDEPPESAAATLQSYVSRLRRFVELGDGTALVNRAPGYVLEVAERAVDAGRFELGLTEGRALLDIDPADALERLEAALGEWRGDAFAEFAETEWIRPEAVRLEELRLVAVETRVDAELRVGRHHEVVGEVDGLRLEHPLRETLTRQAMLALYRSGRQAEALRVAQEFRATLRDDLGLEPSAELRALEAAILEEREDLAWVPPAPSTRTERAATRGRDSLPIETTALVGRERDLALAMRLLETGRILTLFGPGGVGKTRLAQRLAGTLADRFADGVRLVELAPVRDEGAVAAAFAAALDVQRRPHRSLEESIVELLAPQSVLLVLDNCEHVLDTISELVEQVLQWCPDVQVLATSREPLGIPAEVVWSVPPLPVPMSADLPVDELVDVPAVQLFVERAGSAQPEFALDDDNRAAVAELCIRLDGVPLALELAAARMRSMSPAQLAERLPERFRVLAGSRRATDPRHRTLRDLVEWSYDLLTPVEQLLFDRLSVFAGSFVLERAERVCEGDGIDARDIAGLLGVLVDKSMLVAQDGRFRLLETLREFGREQLAARPDADAIRDAHVAVHAELSRAAARGLGGPEEGQWMRELDASFDDVRAAHRGAVAAGDVDSALRIVIGVREYAWRRIRYEHLAWVDVAVALPGASEHELFPVALGVVAYGHFVRGELEAAMEVGARAVAEAVRLGSLTAGLAERALANVCFYQQRPTEAMAWGAKMLEAAVRADAPNLVAHAYYMFAVAQTSLGRHARGREYAESSAAAAIRSGSPTALAQADYARGISLASSDPRRALELFDRSVQRAESVGNRWIRAFALTESEWIRAQQGDPAGALAGYRDVVDTWYRGGDWANLRLTLRNVFAILESVGRDEPAAVLYGALEAEGVMQALPVEPSSADEFVLAAKRLTDRLDPVVLADAVEHGRTLSDDDVVRYVLRELAAA
jgi:predicted ATPase/DNA-binding SARP family transcriptional activator